MQPVEIQRYLRMVGEDLAERRLVGEIVLVGGAYMSLVLRAREATKDIRLHSSEEALGVVKTYVPARLLTARVQYVVESLFDDQAHD